MKKYETGATRNKRDHKYEIGKFISPVALSMYSQYMHGHRVQADGTLRDGDNWQKGIPSEDCGESLLRHSRSADAILKGFRVIDPDTGEPETILRATCGAMFNSICILHNYAVEHDIPVCFGELKGKADGKDEG